MKKFSIYSGIKIRNIKLLIEYEGTNYSGWQVQRCTKTCTIQETIEATIEKILQKKIKLAGAARTDAGVHSKGQVANFKTNSSIELCKLQQALNKLLPDEIVIVKIEDVCLNFDSRYSSKAKLYEYKIFNKNIPSAFLHKFSWYVPFNLNIEAMNEGAKFFIGEQDFSSFCASKSSRKNKICKIEFFEIEKRDDCIIFSIKGTNFLYKMVRNIVGTLVEVGRGKLVASDIKDILARRDRKLAGPTAPAKGLMLVRVDY